MEPHEIDVEAWWNNVDLKLIEGIVYKWSKVEPIVAEEIAPWLPPSCRGVVVNTEHKKG